MIFFEFSHRNHRILVCVSGMNFTQEIDILLNESCYQVLLELARNRNKIPLQKSIAGHGIPLPPEQDTLISPNYQLAIPRKQSAQAVEETEEDDEAVDPTLPSQEQKVDLPQQTQQRVSFPLVKRPK